MAGESFLIVDFDLQCAVGSSYYKGLSSPLLLILRQEINPVAVVLFILQVVSLWRHCEQFKTLPKWFNFFTFETNLYKK